MLYRCLPLLAVKNYLESPFLHQSRSFYFRIAPTHVHSLIFSAIFCLLPAEAFFSISPGFIVRLYGTLHSGKTVILILHTTTLPPYFK